MKKKLIASIICLSLFANLPPVFAADTKSTTPEPYEEDEFPSWLKDLRRAEIITLGAMPFITLNTSLCYSFGNYAFHNFDSDYFVNPFAQGSDTSSYTSSEQAGILITSLGICLGIGITDFIVHSVKRSNQKKKMRTQKKGNINIESVADDPEATKILPPPLHQPPFDADNNTGETINIPPDEIHTDVQNGSSAERTAEKNKTELTEIDAAGNEIFEKSPESEENQPESGSVKSAKKTKKARKIKTTQEKVTEE